MSEQKTYEQIYAEFNPSPNNTLHSKQIVSTVAELIAALQKLPQDAEVFGVEEEPVIVCHYTVTWDGCHPEIRNTPFVVVQTLD